MKLLIKYVAALCGFFILSMCSHNRIALREHDSSIKSSSLISYEELFISTVKKNVGAIYLDTVRLAQKNDTIGVDLIGNLPDGCSQLFITESLHALSISSLKDPNAICTSSLVPFRIFYAFKSKPSFQFKNEDSLVINSRKYPLWK